MPKKSGREALYGLSTLLICAVLIHAIYATVIRPPAQVFSPLSTMMSLRAERAARRHPRSMFLAIKSYEQEAALILAAWALSLLARQAWVVTRHRLLLGKRYVDVQGSDIVMPENTSDRGKTLEALPENERHMLLPRALLLALDRFGVTRSVQDAEEAVREECEAQLTRWESQLAMIRFTAWAIPAIGFIGTARGISAALREARDAEAGDLTGVTLCLGITCTATLTALVLCILVVYCLHQLQQAQDRVVLDTRAYVDRFLIRHMQVP
jgi:biopolymer transport protein ExbB/TolQ